MAANLEVGRGNGRVGKNLQGVRSSKGKGNGNNAFHGAGSIKGKASYPNVTKQAEVITGSRKRGKTLDTRIDPFYQP